MPEGSYRGLQENVRDLVLPGIDVWENKYPDREYAVKFETSEFTCICPKTGLPDFARIYVEYCPAADCIELKSFKEYMTAYRNLGIFHENVINRMLTDLVKACSPRWMRIKGEFNTRGGITTTVESEWRE